MGREFTVTYVVAVRALCEFTAKSGSLDLRFTPSPSAQEGIAGHAAVALRRPAHYLREMALEGEFGELRVRGRADGYDPVENRLEEIKTFRGDLARQPANHRALHWAQLKIYGWLLCREHQLPAIELALVYFDIDRGRETVLTEHCDAATLLEFFEEQCTRFIHWARQEREHRTRRNTVLEALLFPHRDYRSGQRELAEATYKSARTGRVLLAQAPTGIGKTIGTLFPLLKSATPAHTDRIVYLAAKTPGRALALDAMALLRGINRHGSQDRLADDSARPLRVLELVAREKACEHPDKACHGESCPLANGFYDRLGAARDAAVARGWLDQANVREIALQHDICPYYLSQELARWSDVIVGDYNYWFDLGALLASLAQQGEWRVALLVDEAHNLIERARLAFSARLDQRALAQLRETAPAALEKPLQKLARAWSQLTRAQGDDYTTCAELPDAFMQRLQQTVAAIGDHLVDHPTGIDSALQNFYFDALRFNRSAELFDSDWLFDITTRAARPRSKRRYSELNLRNIVPARLLAPRFELAQSTTLFSATLQPTDYYRDLLGLPASTVCLEVESPFMPEQLQVRIATHISTRYADREQSMTPIAELLAHQYRELPGNYLAFFSSYAYLQPAADLLQALHPDIPQWRQARSMSEAERLDFLDRFQPQGSGIGFAVLGGAFSEGIDLPGARLIGAFIATLGMPQINPVNEQIRERLQIRYGRGFDYTYFYPGLQKVVQAAGRVIRTPADQGVIWLIDDRFARPEALRLLPRWWRPRIVSSWAGKPAD